MSKRWAVAAGILAVTTIGAAGVGYAEIIKVNVPAPVSTAEAVAADVGGVVGVGHTASQTGPATGTATANALEIGGTPPIAAVGSTQDGVGATANALLDTKQTPLGRLEVAPSNAKVEQAGGTKTAEGNAALARANVLNPETVKADVLQSSSQTSWESNVSRAFSSSDALVLRIGGADGLTLRVLHSESSSEGHGFTYLLALNDQPLVSIDELGKQICAVDLGDLLDVACLAVSGGVGSVTTEVLGVDVGGPDGLVTDVVKSAGAGGTASVTSTDTSAAPTTSTGSSPTAGAPGVLGTQTTRGAGTDLARTGIENVLFFASAAIALMLLGAAMLRFRVVFLTARR